MSGASDFWEPRYGGSQFYWMCCLSLAANFHLSSRTLCNDSKHSLDPSFEEFVHRHRPRDAFQVACSSEPSFLNRPFDRLHSINKLLSPQGTPEPAPQGVRGRHIRRNSFNSTKQLLPKLNQPMNKGAVLLLRFEGA